MTDTTAHANSLVGALAAHAAVRTERASIRTVGTPRWRITYVTTCVCGVTTENHPEHVAVVLNRVGLVAQAFEAENGARVRHPAGKGLASEEIPPSRRTLLERLEDAEIDLASARTVQERAQVAFEEANGNVGVAAWERAIAADALIAHINGGAA